MKLYCNCDVVKRNDLMLLFLGAGASKPFDIPDMNDLTSTISKELKAKYIDPWIIEEIKKKAKRFGMKPDIESVLTCIDSLCDPEKGIRNAGPFAALISQFAKAEHMTYGQKKEYYENLAKETREIIRNHCFLPKDEKIADIVKVYDNLIEESLKISIHDDLFVFTTNYDNCFEEYCSRKGYDFFDGFKLRRGVQIFVGMDNPNRSWKVCKLHGSSNYVITDRDILVKTDEVIKIGNRITAGRIVKESMIFPTTEKYFSGDPYFNLLGKLREELTGAVRDKERIVVIGYSFRDPAINNAFYDAFKNMKSKILFIINPNVDEIVGKNIPELKNIIRPVDKEFEEIGSYDFMEKEFKKIFDEFQGT